MVVWVLYALSDGAVMTIRPPGGPWGEKEVVDGDAVPPFGLLKTTADALPNVPQNWMTVADGKVIGVEPPQEPVMGGSIVQ